MRRFFKIVIMVIVCVLISATLFVLIFNRGMNQIKKIEIKDIDLSQIKDGEYLGQYASGRWHYMVRVIVSGGEIKNIEILNEKSGFIGMNAYKQLNDEVISRVLKNQSLKIDAVTGATVSTKALLKALENALTKQ
ncbi:FMN-binding protein [Pseudothermotoga elfii]